MLLGAVSLQEGAAVGRLTLSLRFIDGVQGSTPGREGRVSE